MITLMAFWQIGQPLQAATFFWDDGGGDGLWSTVTNWDDVSAPGTGDTATFNAASAITIIDLGTGVTIGTLAFDTASAAAYTIGAGGVNSQTLTLDNGGSITMASTVAADQLIHAVVTLGNDDTASTYTLDNDSLTNSLTIAGTITGSSAVNAAGVKTLAVTGEGATILNGVISDGGATSLGITKDGAGTLTLTENSTFTGNVQINAGTLQVFNTAAKANALGTGTATLTLNGGTLELRSDATTDYNRATTVTADSTVTLGRVSAGTNVDWRLASLSIGAQTLTVNDLDNGGASTTDADLVIDGATTLTGNATFNIVNVDGGTTMKVNGIGDGGNAFSVTKTGSGVLQYNSANTYTGGTIIDGGTLLSNNVDGIADNTTVTQTAGTLQIRQAGGLGGSRVYDAAGTAAKTISFRNDASTTFEIGTWTQSGSGTLTIQATRATSSGGTGDTWTINEDIALNGNLVLSSGVSGSTFVFDGIISEASGSRSMEKQGAGLLRLTDQSTYSGTTTIDNGILQLGVADALPTGTRLLFDPETGETATFDLNGFNQTIGQFDSQDVGASVVTNTGALATLTIGNGDKGGTFRNGTGTGSAGLSSITGAVAITKTGTGTITLNNTGTYTGDTTINGGALEIGNGAVGASIVVGSTGDGALAFVGAPATPANPAAITLASNANLTLGSATNVGTVLFKLGANTAGSDTITFAGTGVLNVPTAGNGLISGYDIGGFTAGAYDLITGPNDISAGFANLALGALPGGFTYTLSNTDGAGGAGVTTVTLTSAAAAAGDVFWLGDVDASWATLAGGDTNWATDLAGAPANFTPGSGQTVNFSATGAANFATTLDNIYSVAGINLLAASSDVSIAQGNALGSLTIGSGGIDVAVGRTLDISASIVGTGASVTKTGVGTLTLSGANTFDGGVILNAGTLNINSADVLGATAGTFVINGGVIDNTSGAAIVNAGNNAQTWNADFTFTGSNDLDLGTGDVTLGADRIVTVSANKLTVQKLTGAFALTKEGAGTLETGTATDYSGVTTINAGFLQGSTTNNLSANSAYVINAGGTLRLNNQSQTIGSLAGSGTVENNGGTTGADTLTVGGNNSSTVFSGTLQNGAFGVLALTKVGTGTLELSSAGTFTGFTGNLTANGGLLKITGTIDNVAGGTGTADMNAGVADNTTGMIYVGGTGSVTTDTVALGNGVTGRNGSLVIDGGSVTLTALAGAGITAGNGGYGYVGLRSGSLTGNRFESNNNGNGVAVFRIDGGTLTSNEFIILRNEHTEFTVAGGQVLHVNAGANISLAYQNGGTAVMNIANATVNNTGRDVTFGQVSTNNGGYTGTLNLNAGGNLITDRIINTQRGGTSQSTVNFNGGTLTATSNASDFFNDTAGLTTYVHGGGVVIDTAGSQVTISEALEAPTGTGLTGLTVSNAGSGYIGAPYVEITGDGTGATGYATVDLDPDSGTFGQVTGVVITNPGTGYTTATVNLLGGVGTGAVIDTPLFGANTSGGLTKQGAGTLILSGLNTYTGGTTITGGTLALGVNDALASAGFVTIQGGATFDLDTFTNTVGQVILEDGIISGSTGVLTSTSAFDLRKGTVSGILAGSVGLNKTTGDTVALSGANTFSGAVSVTGGTLAFEAANNLGDGSAANTLSVNGGTLSYTGITTATLSVNQVLSIGTSGATLDTAFGAGTLELTGGITTAGAASLTKTGVGTVTVSGSTDLNGGAVTVSGGTLNAGFAANGISGITLSGGASALNLFDGATTTTNITALSLGSGNALGFDLAAPGTNDLLSLTGSAATLGGGLILNFNDVGGFAAGTYTVVTSALGGLSTDPANDYSVGFAPSGLNLSFATSDASTIILTASALNLVYWQGDQDGSWITNNTGNTNWSSVADGSADLGALPVATDTLVFSTTNATGPSFSTTLDGSRTADSLQFIAAPAGVTDFTVAQGSGGTLTLTPASSNNGISVGDNAGAVTISAPLATGAAQTWEVIGTGANGSSLTLSGGVAFNHAVVKTGDGVLTLGGAGTGAGGLTVNGGTVELGSDTAFGAGLLTINPGVTLDATGGARDLTNNNLVALNGSFTFTGSNTLDLGTGAVTMGNNAVVTVSASTLTIGGIIDDGASNFTLTKGGAGTLVLDGANTHGGGATLAGGTLNLGHASALGTGTFTIGAGTTFDNTSGGALTLAGNLVQVWQGDFTFTGTDDLNLGTGGVTMTAPVAITVADNTLTIGGVIDDDINAFALTKLGTGTLVLSGLNDYDGRTKIHEGAVQIGVTNALPTDQVVELGVGSTAGTLDLNGFDVTIAGLEVRSATDTVTNNLIIDTGRTLTVSGDVVFGADAATSSTKVVASGGGSLVVNGSSFQVGGSTVSTNSNAADADLSGLANFTANLGLGTLRVGDVSQVNDTDSATSDLRLATNNTITAANLYIGMGTASQNTGDPHSLILGSGTNVFNVNTIAVGSGTGSSNSRSSGEMVFEVGDTTGTLKIRGADGVSAASTLHVGNSTSTVNQSWTSTVNLNGHSADILVGDLIMGQRISGSTGNGNVTSTLSFDTGTFTLVDDLFMARRTTTGTGDATATLNIGGGTFTVGDDTTMSAAAGGNAGSTTTATINVSGGAVFFNGAFSMASADADQTATSTLNITGGTVTMTPSVTVTGAGTKDATIILDGGTLDMTDSNIGAAGANQITFDARSGTLMNLNNLNGGGDLTKTTGGTLILEGVNDYAGNIIVSAGRLQLGDGSGDGSGSVAAAGTLSVASGATFAVNQNDTVIQGADFSSSAISGDGGFEQAGTGTTVFTADNTYAGPTSVSAGTLQLGDGGGTGGIGGSSGVTVASGALLKTNRDSTLTLSQVITGAGAVEVANAATGITVLTGASDYAGATTVAGGALQVGDGTSGSLTGSGSVTVSNAGSKLSGSGTIAGSTIIGSGTILAPGVGDTATSNQTLTFTAVSTAVQVQDGGQIQLGLTSSSQIDGSFDWTTTDALTYLNTAGGTGSTEYTTIWALSGDYDSIRLTNGTFDLGVTAGGTIKLSDSGTTGYTAGSIFKLLDWSTVGTADSLLVGSGGFTLTDLDFSAVTLGAGLVFDTTAFTTYGVVVIVPEPSRAFLIMLGLLGLMLRRRRR